MIADSLALSTFDLASACFGALRRQAGGSQANDSGLPEAGNGRSLGLNRLPFGGCRLNEITPETASETRASVGHVHRRAIRHGCVASCALSLQPQTCP